MKKEIPESIERLLGRGLPKDYDPRDIETLGESRSIDPTEESKLTVSELRAGYKTAEEAYAEAAQIIGKGLEDIEVPVNTLSESNHECVKALFGEKASISFADYKKLMNFIAKAGQELATQHLEEEGII